MKLRVTYDGPALDSHEMDVRDLAPALMAISDLFDGIGEELAGVKGHVTVRVHGSFRTGSFGVDLSLAVNAVTHLMDFFSRSPLAGTATLVVLVDAFYRLIELCRRMRGREILRIEQRGQDFFVILEDQTEFKAEEDVLKLLYNRGVVETLNKVLSPVRQDGVERVAFGTDEEVKTVVTKEELPYFARLPESEELLADDERKMVFSLVSVAFKEDNKWRVSDGQNTLYLSVEDPAFLARMDHGESFAKGDLLIGMVRIRQWKLAHTLRTEYALVKVLEHRRSSQQMSFPFHTDPPST